MGYLKVLSSLAKGMKVFCISFVSSKLISLRDQYDVSPQIEKSHALPQLHQNVSQHHLHSKLSEISISLMDNSILRCLSNSSSSVLVIQSGFLAQSACDH